MSCEGEAEYALAETVGFRLRFWFGEGLLLMETGVVSRGQGSCGATEAEVRYTGNYGKEKVQAV